jgi:hypothetical protein
VRRIIIRTVVGIVVLAAIVAAAGGGFYWTVTSYFNPAPPPLDYPKPASPLEAQRQDLDYFRKLVALDRSFSDSARAAAAREIDELESSSIVLAEPKLRVALMKVLALADNGHTHLGSDNSLQPEMLPIGVRLFSDGLYILAAHPDYANLLGGRVVAIDAVPIDTVMQKLETLRGGTALWRRYLASDTITTQDVLYGAGIASAPDRSAWTVIMPDGTARSRVIAAFRPKDSSDPSLDTHRWLSPEPVKGLGWVSFKPDAVPATNADFDKTFRAVRIPESCAMLIQLKSNVDVGKERIADFISATTSEMKARPPCAAIVDMRYNGGGDYTNTYTFAHRLPTLVAPEGRLFVLTAPSTFSAAITTTAFLKDAGGDRVTILGEPVGDRLAFFSEGSRGCLPHAHLCVRYQTGKHDYAHPCTDWRVCYWINWFYPVRVKTLQPDETIKMSFADWKAGRDPAFDRAFQLASERNDSPPGSQGTNRGRRDLRPPQTNRVHCGERLREFEDHVVQREAVAFVRVDFLDRAVALGDEHVLHLHRFDDG